MLIFSAKIELLAPSSGQIPNRTYNPKRLIYPYFNFLGWVLFFKRIFDAGCLFPETNPTQTRRISFNEADNQLQESPKTCQRSTNYFLLPSSLSTFTGKQKNSWKLITLDIKWAGDRLKINSSLKLTRGIPEIGLRNASENFVPG